mmetsp:Transcript_29977/g.84573  ORF Transcript_29977/g.84573 Transcript_29977/m.84573 type:complete len:238 (-) Transcript_29977:18-731(-)
MCTKQLLYRSRSACSRPSLLLLCRIAKAFAAALSRMARLGKEPSTSSSPPVLEMTRSTASTTSRIACLQNASTRCSSFHTCRAARRARRSSSVASGSSPGSSDSSSGSSSSARMGEVPVLAEEPTRRRRRPMPRPETERWLPPLSDRGSSTSRFSITSTSSVYRTYASSQPGTTLAFRVARNSMPSREGTGARWPPSRFTSGRESLQCSLTSVGFRYGVRGAPRLLQLRGLSVCGTL